MEFHAKKGGTVEWLIKPFHPFNLPECKWIWGGKAFLYAEKAENYES
jgi:hypothetical protein